MRRLRKLTYAATFLLAIGLCFAFTGKKARTTYTAYFQEPDACSAFVFDDPGDECAYTNAGSFCTAYDPLQEQYETVYANFINGALCEQPLRLPY